MGLGCRWVQQPVMSSMDFPFRAMIADIHSFACKWGHHIGCTLEQTFAKDPKAIFDVALGVNGFMYRVDFIEMTQTNVSAGGSRQRRLRRGDPPLDLERYIGWASLEDIFLIVHLDPNTGNVSCLIPVPFENQ